MAVERLGDVALVLLLHRRQKHLQIPALLLRLLHLPGEDDDDEEDHGQNAENQRRNHPNWQRTAEKRGKGKARWSIDDRSCAIQTSIVVVLLWTKADDTVLENFPPCCSVIRHFSFLDV